MTRVIIVQKIVQGTEEKCEGKFKLLKSFVGSWAEIVAYGN